MDHDLRATLSSPYVLIGSLLVALFLLVFVLSTRKSKSQRGNALLLLVYNQQLPAHTSLQTNSSTFSLPDSKPLAIIDVPGHPRIRDQFRDHLADAKIVAFVVDASTVSRNAAAVAEHLHIIMHAFTNIPPSQTLPTLLILGHKCDLLKSSLSTDITPESLAINRVRTVLERELEKRRAAQSGSLGVEGLGAEDERTDIGGLECTGASFSFDDWEGGEVVFVGTSVKASKDVEKMDGLASLREMLQETM
ncbi:hypothetical protein CPB85DRAFT_1269251 [Mucidula mucida]|nr:hypothetical protein CPB85DRAFT_1269251 [Mucidula mucida]